MRVRLYYGDCKGFRDGLGNKMVEQACLLFPHIRDKIDTTVVDELGLDC